MALVPNPQDVTGVPDKPKGPPAAPVDLTKTPPQAGYIVTPGAPGPTLTAATRVLTAIGVLGVGSWALKVVGDSFQKNTPKRAKTAIRRLGARPARIQAAIEHEIASVFSQLIVTSSPPLARWLHYEARVLEQATGTIMAMSEWTYDALNILRHRTVPNLINAKIRPLIRAINRLDPSAPNLASEWRAASTYINTALRAMPWGTGTTFETVLRQQANALLHTYTQLFNFVQPKLNQLHDVRVPALERAVTRIQTYDDYLRTQALPDIRGRLSWLERNLTGILSDAPGWVYAAIGLGLTPVIGAAAVRRAFGNVTCDNTSTFNGDLCAAPAGSGRQWSNILGELAALALGLAILIDPKEVVRIGGGVEGVLEPGVKWMADLTGESFAAAEGEIAAAVASFLGL